MSSRIVLQDTEIESEKNYLSITFLIVIRLYDRIALLESSKRYKSCFFLLIPHHDGLIILIEHIPKVKL